MGTYTLWNLTRTPRSAQATGAPHRCSGAAGSGPRASADPASPRCRASGHHRGRRGAADLRPHLLQPPSRAAPFPPFRGKLGLDLGTGRKRQPNCSSDHRLGKGGSAFRNFSHFSLSVSVFWCLQNLQRFAYFDSSGVRAVLGSTRR